jgi:U3 small nucleolar RNA-associated protein 18
VILQKFDLIFNTGTMAKHSRKRQKTSKGAKEIQPLGSRLLTDDASRDDEERRLESLLFGTKFVPREKNELIVVDSDDEDIEIEGGGQEMNILMDTDVSSSRMAMNESSYR